MAELWYNPASIALPFPRPQPPLQSFPWALGQPKHIGDSSPCSYKLVRSSTKTLTWICCPQLQIPISLKLLQLLVYSPTHACANNSPGTSQPKPSPRAPHPGLLALLQCCIASTAGEELLNFIKKHFSFPSRGFSYHQGVVPTTRRSPAVVRLREQPCGCYRGTSQPGASLGSHAATWSKT